MFRACLLIHQISVEIDEHYILQVKLYIPNPATSAVATTGSPPAGARLPEKVPRAAWGSEPSIEVEGELRVVYYYNVRSAA